MSSVPPRVLITGAAGNLGRVLRRHLAGNYRLRLTDILPMDPAGPGEEVVQCDLADADAARDACADCFAIIHLAANPHDAPWAEILSANISASINVYEGARAGGVDRVIFGSSNHATGLYRRTDRLDATTPARPDSRYGLSKAFGEDLASMFAYKHGIRSFCLRIGTCSELPPDARSLSTWLSYPDFVRLVRTGLTADYRFEIAYGVSRTSQPWWDISNATRLGYAPEDDAETFRAEIADKVAVHPVDQLLQGSYYASTEFSADLADIPHGPTPVK